MSEKFDYHFALYNKSVLDLKLPFFSYSLLSHGEQIDDQANYCEMLFFS